MKQKARKVKAPLRSSQVPATAAMLYEMEGHLFHRMDKGFNDVRTELKAEIADLRAELKTDITGIRADIGGIRSEISGIKSELHRVALIVEEQNARNKYVMDGYAQIYELLVQNFSPSR